MQTQTASTFETPPGSEAAGLEWGPEGNSTESVCASCTHKKMKDETAVKQGALLHQDVHAEARSLGKEHEALEALLQKEIIKTVIGWAKQEPARVQQGGQGGMT